MQSSLLDLAGAGPRRTQHFGPGESSEWYTPALYIEAARAVMGGIDLDPASCEVANRTVLAERFFDRASNGLEQLWAGRVWLNPPYSDYKGQAARWAGKLLQEYLAKRVQQAVMLVNLSTAYQPAMQALGSHGLICLVSERIRFESSGGAERQSPTQANMFVYLGQRQSAFREHFGRYGLVLAPVAPERDSGNVWQKMATV